jgi:hypothetical protein
VLTRWRAQGGHAHSPLSISRCASTTVLAISASEHLQLQDRFRGLVSLCLCMDLAAPTALAKGLHAAGSRGILA